MGKISSYPKDVDISLTDKLLGTDAENSSFTKNFEVSDVVSFLRTQSIGSQGPIGPQGIQGATGPAGAVGPAGLNWQGTWVSGTLYNQNDAVSYNGASWFLYTIDNEGSENESPQDNASNWALLASQGATGPAGAQGPTGAQGPQGSFAYKSCVASMTVTFGGSGGVLTITEHENTLGGPVTFSYNPSGYIECTSSSLFTSNKTWLPSTTIAANGQIWSLNPFIGSTSLITYFASKTGDYQLGFPFSSTIINIEIRVYN